MIEEKPLPGIERLPDTAMEQLRAIRGLTAAVSDVLDQLGWNLVVPATVLVPRNAGSAAVVGYAITSEYMPVRQREANAASSSAADDEELSPPLFNPGFRLAARGDVLVMAAHRAHSTSAFGGRVAAAAMRAGVGGVVVDGAVRDLDEVQATGLPVWSRGVTPISGKGRLEQVSINERVVVADVQVRPGDLVMADASGVCFVPADLAVNVACRVLRISAAERAWEARERDRG